MAVAFLALCFAGCKPRGYPEAKWLGPAGEGNCAATNGPRQIDLIILHTTETSAASARDIFKTAKRGVSAHYLVTTNGQVWQFVEDDRVAYHAGNLDFNRRSIGIELEGWADGRGEERNFAWQTEEQRDALVRLIGWLCDKHGIAKSRAHIIGHNQVPSTEASADGRPWWGGKSQHHDPGARWDWTELMRQLNRAPEFLKVVVQSKADILTMPNPDAPRICSAQPGDEFQAYAEHDGFALVVLKRPADAQPLKEAGNHHWDGWIAASAVRVLPAERRGAK